MFKKKSIIESFIVVICVVAVSILTFVHSMSFAACSIRTADPSSTADVCSIVTWLRNLPQKKVNNILSGQYGWKDVELIHNITKKWPALYEDFLWQKGVSSWNDWSVAKRQRELIKQYWDNGGIVSIHMPIPNPKNMSFQDDRDLTDDEFAQVSVDGTKLNRNYLEWMSNLATQLRWLEEKGVVVFIRPLHEMNGGWFWYGKRNPEDFKRLFRMTIQFLTEKQGLHRTIVIYAPNKGKGCGDYYPGDEFVDVIGVDSYQDHPAALSEEYKTLITKGKPFAITEIGWSASNSVKDNTKDSKKDILDGIKTFTPKAVWWSSWSQENSPAHQNECIQLYNNPAVMTRDEVDWRRSVYSGPQF